MMISRFLRSVRPKWIAVRATLRPAELASDRLRTAPGCHRNPATGSEPEPRDIAPPAGCGLCPSGSERAEPLPSFDWRDAHEENRRPSGSHHNAGGALA